MVDNDGVIATEDPPTVTVITAELTQVPTVFVTVYVVVIVGLPAVVEFEGVVKKTLGDQE